ncbi:MAG TPA: SRPBCC domain-containing protein [Steroidobacteraceae bacterium]|nr:SRPBCC domain-containing protein [Steroidobacteraceae bacterium]
MAERTRGYAHRIDIVADAPRVWAAITTSAGLKAWCSPDAEITAREGGAFRANVDRVTELEAHIDVFLPERRMRLIHLPSASLPPNDGAIVDDFMLDAGEGTTIVRLLGSGVPATAEWDAPYMRMRIGWERAIARLKVMVEQRSPAAARAAR